MTREGVTNEPNDEAILACAADACKDPHVTCVALLARDQRLCEAVTIHATAHGRQVILLLQDTKTCNTEAVESHGAKVIRLAVSETVWRVQAHLLSAGNGEVVKATTDPLAAGTLASHSRYLTEFLMDKGFYDSEDNLATALAKCWWEHARQSPTSKSRLTVFPTEATIKLMYASIKQGGQWKAKLHDHAFCVPLTGSGSPLSPTKLAEFGSVFQRRVFQGGGPFILPDSPELTVQMLQRLGYVDQHLNHDINEAMLVFLNSSWNKTKLRLLGLLPAHGDNFDAVSAKLREAFLTNRNRPNWQTAPDDAMVRQLLVKMRLLRSVHTSREKVLKAMIRYSKQLPRQALTCTYAGLVWTILRYQVNTSEQRQRDVILPRDDGLF